MIQVSTPSLSLLQKERELIIDARALFEKSALSIPAEKSRPLWDAWARYEYMYGDLAAVNKLEARFKEAFSNGMSTSCFSITPSSSSI
jgi:hypothetical protein